MNFLTNYITGLLSRSFKHALKESWNRFREIVGLCCIWRYQFGVYSHPKFSNISFIFYGLEFHRKSAVLMLDLVQSAPISGNKKQRAFVSDMPLPGSICVPHYLTGMIALKHKSIEEILLGFDKRKRRLINKQASAFTLKQVTDINEVSRLNEEMLKPYAAARHGKTVNQLPSGFVMGMATKYGQLHAMFENGKEVGCLIGYEYIRDNKRCWSSYRAGFPDFIFNDSQNYREKNIIITYLQLEWALNNGFDYYDMGPNQAHTESGILHFKRTFSPDLSIEGTYNYFYLKLPAAIAAQFYWEKPIFAVEGKAVVLHLGLPDAVSADTLVEKYRLLNYGGLSKVYLHCDSTAPSAYTEAVANIYSDQKKPPVLKIC